MKWYWLECKIIKLDFSKLCFSNVLNKYLGKSKNYIWYNIITFASYSCNMGKSLEEVNESVSTLDKKSAFRKILAFWSAYLISVGYMDRKLGDWSCRREPVWVFLTLVLLRVTLWLCCFKV
jgi:hypothetical protein